jgi:hypothetical protein
MGEIADMMLDGTLCEGCGTYLGDDGGFPSRCSACQREYSDGVAIMERNKPAPIVDVPKVACPVCNKKFKITGVGDHWKQKHSPLTRST